MIASRRSPSCAGEPASVQTKRSRSASIPATITGLGPPSADSVLIAVWYLVMTLASLAFAYRDGGVSRVTGALIIGALMGFLWFNVHPAQLFMGDAGALSLGATLAVVATITTQVLLLVVIGAVFVAVTLSVVLQVGSFKLRGRRIFRMAPLQHHFELIGWAEEKITVRFWIVSALAGLVGFSLFLASVNGL